MEDYEGLSLSDLEKLYTEQTKIYNDSGGTNLTLYDDLVAMSKTIEEKKRKLEFGATEQVSKVRCEICNKTFENLPDVLKAHEEYHKTWVKFKQVKPKQLDQVESKVEIKKPVEIISVQETPNENLAKPPQEIIPVLKELQKQEDEFLKELVKDIKTPIEKAVTTKQKMDEKIEIETPAQEKRSWFAKPRAEKPHKEKEHFGFPRRRYKKPSFALKGQFPIFEVLLGGGPIIFMKNADRSIEIMRGKKLSGKFIETDVGVFEIDGEYEHRLNKVASFYLYNIHNSKPLSIRALESVQNYYKQKQTSIIVNELAKIKEIVKKDKDPLTAMSSVFKQKDSQIDEVTQKFLVEYLTFDKDDVKLYIQNRIKTKKPRFTQTRKIQTTFPIVIIGLLATGVLLFMRFFNPLKIFNISPEAIRFGFSMVGS